MKHPVILVGVVVVVGWTVASSQDSLLAQASRTAEAAFKAAQHLEEVEGDLRRAIDQYAALAKGADRIIAARALVRMAECYQKLGDETQSTGAYERVLREFADQTESAAAARARLAALTRAEAPAGPAGVVVRQVWTGEDVDTLGGVSPDGRYLSYVDWATGDLAIRDVSTGETRHLTDRSPGEFAFHSRIAPDGRQVAYTWSDDEAPYHLRLTSLTALRDGVKPRVLYRNPEVNYVQPHDWSPDGKQILAHLGRIDNTNQLVLVTVADGSVRVLKTFDWRYPSARFSPDGRYIAYDFPPKEDSVERDIFVLAADGSRETPLVEHAGDDFILDWAPDGKRILFASDRTGVMSAWIIAVSDGKAQGEPELIRTDIGRGVPMGFTNTGKFFYGLDTSTQDVYLATLDPVTGRIVTLPVPVNPRLIGRGSSPAWSPDGQSLAYLRRRSFDNDVRGPRVICIRSLETGEERELSTSLSFETWYRLHWSPDGRFLLATASDEKRRGGLYQIDIRSGEVERISESFRPYAVWSLDGKAVFYTHGEFGAEVDIRVRDLETGGETVIYPAASRPDIPNNLALSPDGWWLAFGLGNHLESWALMVMPAAGGEARELMRLPHSGGSFTGLEWARDGEHLFFTDSELTGNGGQIRELKPELWRISMDGGEPRKVGLATLNRGGTVAMHPDGRQVAFTAGKWGKAEVWAMEDFLPPLEAAK